MAKKPKIKGGDKKPDMVTKAFARRLKARRIAMNYATAKDFAVEIGIEPATYRTYERNIEPPFSTLLRICQLLKVTPNDLLLGGPDA